MNCVFTRHWFMFKEIEHTHPVHNIWSTLVAQSNGDHASKQSELYIYIYNYTGQAKIQRTVTEGFDNMFDAFIGLFKGENLGKSVVKVW